MAQFYIIFKDLVYCLQNCQFQCDLLPDMYCITIDKRHPFIHAQTTWLLFYWRLFMFTTLDYGYYESHYLRVTKS